MKKTLLAPAVLLFFVCLLTLTPSASADVMFYSIDEAEVTGDGWAIAILLPANNSVLSKQFTVTVAVYNTTEPVLLSNGQSMTPVYPNPPVLQQVTIDVPKNDFWFNVSYQNATPIFSYFYQSTERIPTAPATPEVQNVDQTYKKQQEAMQEALLGKEEREREITRQNAFYFETPGDYGLFVTQVVIGTSVVGFGGAGLAWWVKKRSPRNLPATRHPVVVLVIAVSLSIAVMTFLYIYYPEVQKQNTARQMLQLIETMDLPPELHDKYVKWVYENYTPTWGEAFEKLVHSLLIILWALVFAYGCIWGYNRFEPGGEHFAILEHKIPSRPLYDLETRAYVGFLREDKRTGHTYFIPGETTSLKESIKEVFGHHPGILVVPIGDRNETFRALFNGHEAIHVDRIVESTLDDPEVRNALVEQQIHYIPDPKDVDDFKPVSLRLWERILQRTGLYHPRPTKVLKLYLSTIHTGPRFIIDTKYRENVAEAITESRRILTKLTNIAEYRNLAKVVQPLIDKFSILAFVHQRLDWMKELEETEKRRLELERTVMEAEDTIRTQTSPSARKQPSGGDNG